MKKILSKTAFALAVLLMANTVAFAVCPLKSGQTSCSMGLTTGAAAPVSYIVEPAKQNQMSNQNPVVQQQTVPQNKTMMQKIKAPFTGIYNNIFGPFMNWY